MHVQPSHTASAPLDLPLPYPVYCERGVFARAAHVTRQHAPAHRFAIVSDDTVAPLFATQLLAQFESHSAKLFTIPPGEHEKTRERWTQLTDALFAWGAGRDTTIVALGGGVIGDLAGFVAATFMRGIPVVQIPTTLLAMVDASVGGKTAIDTPYGKNLIGAFHNPRAVIIDPDVLRTLPSRTLRAGLAEMIKHGVVADASYFDAMQRALPDIIALGAEAPQFSTLIAGSVEIKANVVASDERESGPRHVLNFGHTIAHAIERVRHYDIAHGEAVAIGMVVEARLAEALSLAPTGLHRTIADCNTLARLPVSLPDRIDRSAILAATSGDKKNRSGSTRYALPRAIGAMEESGGLWSVPISDALVLEILDTV